MKIRRNKIRYEQERESRMKWQLQSGRNRILADQAEGLIQENEDLRAAVTRLQEMVSSWESFYDWMCDDGRIHEHELPLP